MSPSAQTSYRGAVNEPDRASQPLQFVQFEQVAMLDVAAGSGLAFHRGALVVVADDALVLSRYTTLGAPLGTIRLFEGELPEDPRERKRAKPDLEALVGLPDGSLLVVPSGSTRRRRTGAVLRRARVTVVDWTPLYERLETELDDLNVEGIAMLGHSLALFTRRTGKSGSNAIVRLRLLDTMAALQSPAPRLSAGLLESIRAVDLGAVEGTPLGFTDAARWRGEGVLFSAAAEATDDPIEDGRVVGCIVGRIDATGRVRARWQVAGPAKIEGISVVDDQWLYAVSDADDATINSPLLRTPVAQFE